MDTITPKSPFLRNVIVDRDDAIKFLKRVGFVETKDVGYYSRDEKRTTAQLGAGARYLTVVNIEALLAAPAAWRRFVRRWSKKVAA